MKVLLLVPNYPYPTAPYNGAQNERCAQVLSDFVERLVVVSPRPFIPASLALRSRWKHYASIPPYSVVGGIEVHRPAYLVVPGLLRAVWSNEVAYYMLRTRVAKLHWKHRFDAILSFDLFNAGGLAWRISRELGIPAAGWATGGDMRKERDSRPGRKLVETIRNLDLVFYQSQELLELAAELLGSNVEHLERSGRHRTLSRGINEPPRVLPESKREQLRLQLRVSANEVMILYVGRIIFEKGVFGLLDVFAKHPREIEKLKLVLVGSQPELDETAAFTQHLNALPELRNRVSLLTACSPEKIWGYLNAADIFALPSFKEGMPNSLLEAMISGVPSVTFDIPAIRGIVCHDPHAVLTVQRFDYDRFFEKLLLLSRDEHLRKVTGARGKELAKQHFSLVRNMKVALDSLYALKSMTSRDPPLRLW